MPYEREKRRARDGTYYYVVKPQQRGGRIRSFFIRYFGPLPSDQYQHNTAIRQLQDLVRLFFSPMSRRRKKPPKPPAQTDK